MSATRRGLSVRALLILAAVAAAIYALDRVSKHLVVENLQQGVPVPVLGEFLQLNYVENPGAAFSLLSGTTWVFAIIASAAVVFIIVFARRIRAVSWAILFGLLLGGAAGNLTDRLIRPPGFGVGHVVDFIQVYLFPAIFNFADIAIVTGMGLFILLTLRGVHLDGTRTARTKDESPADAGTDGPTDGPREDAAPEDPASADREA